MICDKCGKIISDGSRFCNECGAPVENYGKRPAWNAGNRFDDMKGVMNDDIDDDVDMNGGIDFDFDDDIEDDGIENIDGRRRNAYDSAAGRSVGRRSVSSDMMRQRTQKGRSNSSPNNRSGSGQRGRPNSGQNSRSGSGPNSRSGSRQNAGKKKQSPNSYLGIIIAAVMIFLAVIIIAGVIIFNSYKASKLSDFEKRIGEYKQAMMDSASVFGEYQELLEEAEQALEAGDLGAFGSLSKRLQEAIEKMYDESDSHRALSDLKATYETIFAKYVITDDYKETYENVMKRLEQAMDSRSEDEARQLGKELETLKNNLSVENHNLVQTAINEINRIDVTHANDAEIKTFEEYKEKVDAFVAEEEYAQALKILDSWKEMAKLTEERIKESESKERERRESESKAKEESEEAARQTESEQPQPQLTGGSYIISDSNSRYLTAEDITPLGSWEKKLARNEIYARHGRRFSDADLQAYFDSQSWYNGTIEPSQFSESVLNDFERKNISLIRSLE